MSKGTTQPKDRLDDHGVNMTHGMESTQIKKGANGAHKAWPPVFKLYGSGKKLTDKVWVCFGVPRNNLTFDEQSARCEIIELASIIKHKNKFNGQAPLTDLKYANTSQREMHNQILALEKSSGLARKTRIQNDNDYKGKVTLLVNVASNCGLMRELRQRQTFEKPTLKRQRKHKENLRRVAKENRLKERHL